MKKRILIGLLIIVMCFVFTGCGKKEIKTKYDYLVLVNKYSKLPNSWESNVQLVNAKNAWNEDIKIEKETYENYQQLAKALKKEGITIELDSVYRSVKEQQELWDNWSNDSEKGIEYVKKYVAVPGYSEHHTGLAVDICLRKDGKLIDENDDMIAEREIFEKIHSRIADYGFILRYVENKDDITGYAYEPWHLRYIGSKEIAKEIMDNNLTFEEYLASVNSIKVVPEAAKYQIEKALQTYFKDIYGNNIVNSRFDVTKVYSIEEEQTEDNLKSLNLGDKDVAFEVIYQLQPATGVDPKTLINPDGEYDETLGWVKNITRCGVLKYNEKDDSYSITKFGTSW